MIEKYNNNNQALFKDNTFSHLISQTIIFILQMRKLKFREVQYSEEDHRAGKYLSMDWLKGLESAYPLRVLGIETWGAMEKILRLEMDYNGKEEVVSASTVLKAIIRCCCQRII